MRRAAALPLPLILLAACAGAPEPAPGVMQVKAGVTFEAAAQDFWDCRHLADAEGDVAAGDMPLLPTLPGLLISGAIKQGRRSAAQEAVMAECLAEKGYTEAPLAPQDAATIEALPSHMRLRALALLASGQDLSEFRQ